MKIISLDHRYLDRILEMYESAREIQRVHNIVVWPDFPREMIAQDMESGLVWAIMENNEPACVWTIAFEDPLIWGEKNNDPSVYIHRIATHPAHRGKMLVKTLVAWADDFARQQHKQYLRMDTVGNNRKLISHYTECGFVLLGMFELTDTTGLPDHYRKDAVCLFERKVNELNL
jgi:GNAT superfamily N-acetyltransferase